MWAALTWRMSQTPDLMCTLKRGCAADTGLHQVMGTQTHLTVGSIKGTWWAARLWMIASSKHRAASRTAACRLVQQRRRTCQSSAAP